LSPKSFIAACLLAILIIPPAAAQSPEAEIRAALTQWTNDFNAGHADKVCDLFAPSLRADVRGAAERDFDTQCQLLRKALADPEQATSEAFELKEVVTERDMAVVRLTWTTTARVKATGQTSTSVYQGLDVFGKGSDDVWRIIRYMAYERP
jgi:ketosteroid isomerase-like protein